MPRQKGPQSPSREVVKVARSETTLAEHPAACPMPDKNAEHASGLEHARNLAHRRVRRAWQQMVKQRLGAHGVEPLGTESECLDVHLDHGTT